MNGVAAMQPIDQSPNFGRDRLELRPAHEEAARNGAFRLVRGAKGFAIARWQNGQWRFASGQLLDFEPEQYASGMSKPTTGSA